MVFFTTTNEQCFYTASFIDDYKNRQKIFFINKKSTHFFDSLHQFSNFQLLQQSIKYQNATIYFQVIGEGRPVFLLHGFGEDGSIWKNQIDALQNDCQLIVPDLPGSGQSGFVKNADIETYAVIIKMIVDSFIDTTSRKISIVGHSMGGYIALAFAKKYPDSLQSLGLFHSTAFADGEEKKLMRKKAIDFIQEKGAYTFLKTSIPGMFNDANAIFIDELIEKGKAFSEPELIQYYKAMMDRHDSTDVLRNFSKPVLFVIGEYDMAVPLQSCLQQCYFPAISHICILKKSAHMGMLEEKEKANAALRSFLFT